MCTNDNSYSHRQQELSANVKKHNLISAMTASLSKLTQLQVKCTFPFRSRFEKLNFSAGRYNVAIESYQLQMGFSFPLLCANNIRLSLLMMKNHISYFLLHREYIRMVSVQMVPKYFSSDGSADNFMQQTKKMFEKY